MELSVRKFNPHSIEAPRDLQRPGVAVGPLDLEIGCGVGWHPIAYAQANADRRLIAIEHTRAKFESFERRLQKHNLANLLAVHADAVRWITHAIGNESLDRVFILYPNPEPQAKNKRWFRMPFMEELLRKLKPNGTITLATNIGEYAAEAREYAMQHWGLELVKESTPRKPRTHFEKKYLERGEECFDLVFRKP